MNATNKRKDYMEDDKNAKRVKKECSYGDKCYRRNPAHLREFSHPHLEAILDASSGGSYTVPPDFRLQEQLIKEQLDIIVEKQLYVPKQASSTTDPRPKTPEASNTPPKPAPKIEIPESSKDETDPKVTMGSNLKIGTSKETNITEKTSASKDGSLKGGKDEKSSKDTGDTGKVKDPSYRPVVRPARRAAEYLTVVRPAGQMLAKHAASAPYHLFYTTIASAKETHDQPYSITFLEILDSSLGELKCSLQINFMVEPAWLLAQYYFAGYSEKKLTILYGEECADLRNISSKKPQVEAYQVPMTTPFGKHHTKMMILCYEDGSLRVVVSTANLYVDDWENRTQGLWFSPACPELPPDSMPHDGESPTMFKKYLLRYLSQYRTPMLSYYVERVKRCDFSSINESFVWEYRPTNENVSMPHDGESPTMFKKYLLRYLSQYRTPMLSYYVERVKRCDFSSINESFVWEYRPTNENVSMPHDGESPTMFKKYLLRYLSQYRTPMLSYYVERVKRCDFSSINESFVWEYRPTNENVSMPHDGESPTMFKKFFFRYLSQYRTPMLSYYVERVKRCDFSTINESFVWEYRPTNENVSMPHDGESPTMFKKYLLRYLSQYRTPMLSYYVERVKRCDFSTINVFLVASAPGGHFDMDWGLTRIGSLLRTHCCIPRTEQSKWPLIAQASSIGSYGKEPRLWLTGDFLHHFTKIKETPQTLTQPPDLKLIYPSLENVKQSHDGLLGGGCLPYAADAHFKQTWLNNYLYQWKAKSSHRDKAMPHIKSYIRTSPDHKSAAYYLLTSGNVSKAAWGTINKGNAALRIMSYEAGVLFLPRFVINEDFFPLDPKAPNHLVVPYDIPPTKYTSDMQPWVQDYLL